MEILFFESQKDGLHPAARPKVLDNYFLSCEMQKTVFRIDLPTRIDHLDKGTDGAPLFNQAPPEDKEQLILTPEEKPARNYSSALDTFIKLLQAREDEDLNNRYPEPSRPQYKENAREFFAVNTGKKYDKVIKGHQEAINKKIGSAFLFIEKETGNILKASDWKTPAKGTRGNIYNENPLKGTTLYGAAYANRR